MMKSKFFLNSVNENQRSAVGMTQLGNCPPVRLAR